MWHFAGDNLEVGILTGVILVVDILTFYGSNTNLLTEPGVPDGIFSNQKS
jgi:hypothetical protein